MYDRTLRAEVQAFALYLERHRLSPLPTDNYDLVLDVINKEDDKIIWAYYYVDHDSKTLFWQDSYECGDSLLREVRGVQGTSHVSAYSSVPRLIPFASMILSIPELRLESLYWWGSDIGIFFILTILIRNEGYIGHFILLAPTGPSVNSRRRRRKSCLELYWVAVLVCSFILLFVFVCWILADSLTSKVSTAPYSVAEIATMRDFIKDAESKSSFLILRTAIVTQRRARRRRSSCNNLSR